jgi:hypothetical protein
MSTPAWTAECSLYRASGSYRPLRASGGSTGKPGIRLQLPSAASGILLRPKQQSCTTTYTGYVVYPMKVCSPPTFPGAGFLQVGGAVPRSTPASRSTANFDFSASVAFDRWSPFCHLSGGPWFARVTTTESCDDVVPNRSVLEIIAAPEPFAIVWDGNLKDIPAPFREQDFGFAGMACDCCAGFTQCPDGRCLPHGVSCDIQPA